MNIDWWPLDRLGEFQTAIDEHWRRGHVLARDAELVRWQYRNRRDPQCLSVLRATDNGRLLGLLGLIQTEFNIFGTPLPAVWLATWLAMPDAPRGTGLDLLRNVMKTEGQIVACLGFNDTAEKIYRALRFTVIDAVPRWLCVTNVTSLNGLLNESPQAKSTIAAMVAARARASSTSAPPGIKIVAWRDDHAPRWDVAWRERLSGCCAGTWRDAAYLQWRYREHPRFRYEIAVAEHATDNSLSGLLVYRIENVADSSAQVARIVELIADDDVAPALAAAAVARAEACGAAFADFFCTLTQPAPALVAAGFIREDELPAPVPMLFQPLDTRRARVRASWWAAPGADISRLNHDGAALYVTRSDGDQDRPN